MTPTKNLCSYIVFACVMTVFCRLVIVPRGGFLEDLEARVATLANGPAAFVEEGRFGASRALVARSAIWRDNRLQAIKFFTVGLDGELIPEELDQAIGYGREAPWEAYLEVRVSRVRYVKAVGEEEERVSLVVKISKVVFQGPELAEPFVACNRFVDRAPAGRVQGRLPARLRPTRTTLPPPRTVTPSASQVSEGAGGGGAAVPAAEEVVEGRAAVRGGAVVEGGGVEGRAVVGGGAVVEGRGVEGVHVEAVVEGGGLEELGEQSPTREASRRRRWADAGLDDAGVQPPARRQRLNE
eukprot:GHVU01017607.1.p1 GENE.GHVU01017607.1~~GHVU01017607.1.p1  ORF type:complete len:297 (+),score=40.97 GHVU01017607.1:1025-1915(+)